MRGVTFSAAGPTPLTPLRTTTSGRHARRCRPGGRWRRPMRTSRPRTTPAARRSTAVRCICRRQLTHAHHHHLATHTLTQKKTHLDFRSFSLWSHEQLLFLCCAMRSQQRCNNNDDDDTHADANKHWNGLIGDFYKARVQCYVDQVSIIYIYIYALYFRKFLIKDRSICQDRLGTKTSSEGH